MDLEPKNHRWHFYSEYTDREGLEYHSSVLSLVDTFLASQINPVCLLCRPEKGL